jgi:hypothetical protein
MKEDDQFAVFYEVRDRKLPSCQYFAIVSPAQKTNGTTHYAEAYQTISFVRTFLAAYFGKLLSYEWVADFDFDLAGQISFSSSYLRLPLFADVVRIVNPSLASAIIERLSLQPRQFREQFQIACNFFNGAMDQKDEALRFSSYWIALEVIARGTSGAIRNRLEKAYNNAPRSFVDTILRFSEIAEIRHNLLHKGQFKTLKSYQERLLQLYFWDVVINEINLPAQGLTQALVQSGIIEEEIRATSGPGNTNNAQSNRLCYCDLRLRLPQSGRRTIDEGIRHQGSDTTKVQPHTIIKRF